MDREAAFELILDATENAYKSSKYGNPDGTPWDEDYGRPGSGEYGYDLDYDSGGWSEISELLDSWTNRGDTFPARDGYTVSVEDYRSGGEENGTVMWLVLKISGPEGDTYWKKNGYWVSHDGGYWEGSFDQVHPRERMITEYV